MNTTCQRQRTTMETRFQEVLAEVKDGEVKVDSITYLIDDHDDEDIILVVQTAIFAQSDKRQKRIGKHASTSVLIATIVQEKLSRDFERAWTLTHRMLAVILDKHLHFAHRLFDDLIMLSCEPDWPAAAFLLRLALKLFICSIQDHISGHEKNSKKTVLSVKTMCKMALSFKKREVHLGQTLSQASGKDLTKLSLEVLAYLTEDNTDKENARDAYKNLWKKQLGTVDDAGIDFILTTKLDAQAALHKIAKVLYLEDFTKYVQYIVLAASSKIAVIKAEASKSLGKLLNESPAAVLSVAGAVLALEDCLCTANGKALPKLIESVCHHLAKYPSPRNSCTYEPHLLRLFDHPAMTVRKAIIDGVAGILSEVRDYPSRELLAFNALRRIEDEEIIVQQAVCRFFSAVFCKTHDSLGLVAVVSVHSKALDFLEKILNQTSAAQRAVCFSQAPLISQPAESVAQKALSPSQQSQLANDTANLDILCSALALHMRKDLEKLMATEVMSMSQKDTIVKTLKENSNECKKLLRTARLIHTIAKVHPAIANQQAEDIVNAFRKCSCEKFLAFLAELNRILEKEAGEGVHALKKLLPELSRTLVCISAYMTPDYRTIATDSAKEKVEKFRLKDVSEVNIFTELLQVLLSFLGNSDHYIQERVASSLSILREFHPTDVTRETDIKKALCTVIYVYQDHDKDKQTQLLIRSYLSSSKYNLTALQSLSESRKIYIPVQSDFYLKKLIVHNLQDASVSDEAVRVSLNYICHTLLGYRNESQLNKSNMKQLGDPTTETVSLLLQVVLPGVLERTLSASPDIRGCAANCLKMMAESGLILMKKIIPHLIALSTDKATLTMASALLTTAAADKWNITIDLVPAIEYAFQLATNLNPTGVVRGFRKTASMILSTCSLPYELIPKAQTEQLKHFVEAVLNKLKDISSNRQLLFFIDQLVYLPYRTVGAVDQAIKSVANYISNASDSGSRLVRLLKAAEAFMEQMYKGALKIASKPQSGKEVAKRNDVPQEDYISEKCLKAIDNNELFLELLKPKDDSDEEKDQKKTTKRSSSTNKKTVPAAKVRKSEPGPSTSETVEQDPTRPNENQSIKIKKRRRSSGGQEKVSLARKSDPARPSTSGMVNPDLARPDENKNVSVKINTRRRISVDKRTEQAKASQARKSEPTLQRRNSPENVIRSSTRKMNGGRNSTATKVTPKGSQSTEATAENPSERPPRKRSPPRIDPNVNLDSDDELLINIIRKKVRPNKQVAFSEEDNLMDLSTVNEVLTSEKPTQRLTRKRTSHDANNNPHSDDEPLVNVIRKKVPANNGPQNNFKNVMNIPTLKEKTGRVVPEKPLQKKKNLCYDPANFPPSPPISYVLKGLKVLKVSLVKLDSKTTKKTGPRPARESKVKEDEAKKGPLVGIDPKHTHKKPLSVELVPKMKIVMEDDEIVSESSEAFEPMVTSTPLPNYSPLVGMVGHVDQVERDNIPSQNDFAFETPPVTQTVPLAPAADCNPQTDVPSVTSAHVDTDIFDQNEDILQQPSASAMTWVNSTLEQPTGALSSEGNQLQNELEEEQEEGDLSSSSVKTEPFSPHRSVKTELFTSSSRSSPIAENMRAVNPQLAIPDVASLYSLPFGFQRANNSPHSGSVDGSADLPPSRGSTPRPFFLQEQYQSNLPPSDTQHFIVPTAQDYWQLSNQSSWLDNPPCYQIVIPPASQNITVPSSQSRPMVDIRPVDVDQLRQTDQEQAAIPSSVSIMSSGQMRQCIINLNSESSSPGNRIVKQEPAFMSSDGILHASPMQRSNNTNIGIGLERPRTNVQNTTENGSYVMGLTALGDRMGVPGFPYYGSSFLASSVKSEPLSLEETQTRLHLSGGKQIKQEQLSQSSADSDSSNSFLAPTPNRSCNRPVKIKKYLNR